MIALDPVAAGRNAASRRTPADANTTEIDATGKYVLPGLINAHAHLQDERGGTSQPIDYELKIWLASGITAVRDVGSTTTKALAWRDASAKGTTRDFSGFSLGWGMTAGPFRDVVPYGRGTTRATGKSPRPPQENHRGTCTFFQKAQNAEAAGAIGVIIFNEGQPGRTETLAGTLGDPDPLGSAEPPGHTTVRNANLLHPMPMTPSLMSRGVFYPEQIELFADTCRRVLVEGERLSGVGSLRIQRGKLFHTTRLPGVGSKTRARILASGLLDDEYTYENLAAIQGVTEAQARTIAEVARIDAGARTEVRVP